MVDRSPEQDWFRVYVGEDAEFIVSAESGDSAEQEIKQHCKDNPYLLLDPTMMLDHGVWAKPLEFIDADYYQKLATMTGLNTIRLIADKRNLPQPSKERKNNSINVNEDQLALFGMERSLTNRNDYVYSYYNE